MLVCQHEGTAMIRQGQVVLATAPGGIFLQDLARPWVFRCPGPMSMTMVKIPYSRIVSRIADPVRLLEQSYAPDDPATMLVRDIVASVQRALALDSGGALNSALEDLMLDALGILDRPAGAVSALRHDQRDRSAIRRRAMRHVGQHLADPDLTVSGIASALGVSERCLQRAFLETGETPVQYIRNQRLDLAAERLGTPHGGSRASVLDTAMAVGFSDVSHFSRSFSRRFGCSPGRYRGLTLSMQ
jgi:AraC-like DNA-binding protein